MPMNGRGGMGGPMGGGMNHGGMGGGMNGGMNRGGMNGGMNRGGMNGGMNRGGMGGQMNGGMNHGSMNRPMDPMRGGMDRPMGSPAPRMGGFGMRPHHAAPFGLVLANIVWNRAHYQRLRRILEKMTYNEPIGPIEERTLWESFGRRIEYYEAADLLAWVDRELGYF